MYGRVCIVYNMYACTCTDEFYRNDGFSETNPKKSFIHMGKH